MFMDGIGSATQQKYKYNVVQIQFKYIEALAIPSNTNQIQKQFKFTDGIGNG